MWPEYPIRRPLLRNIRGLHGDVSYDLDGLVTKLNSYNELKELLFSTNSACYVESLVDSQSFSWLYDAVADSGSKVLCDRLGKPLAVRMRSSNSTRWIIQADAWNSELSLEFINNMWDLFDYFNVGFATTPGALGSLLMKQVHQELRLKKQTALSLQCEEYLRNYSPGGVVWYPKIGGFYEEASDFDLGSAYVAMYDEHPASTAISFKLLPDQFVTYFAECTVNVRTSLPVLPFIPNIGGRRNNNSLRYKTGRNSYMGARGTYKVHLWREQIEDCIDAGCDVKVHSGYGWNSVTNINAPWAEKVYYMRKNSPTEFIEKQSKAAAVAAIGHHGMSRERFYLVGEDEAEEWELCVPDIEGNPLLLFVRSERDDFSATMMHWNKYTIMRVNREVYHFALPFAEEGRLIAMDHDAILAVSKPEDKVRHILRHSPEAFSVPPGTWLLTQLHDVKIVAPRSYISREKTRTPGVPADKRELVYA